MLLNEVLAVLEENNLPYKYCCGYDYETYLTVVCGYLKFIFMNINDTWELIHITSHDISFGGRGMFFQISDEGEKFSILSIMDYSECTLSGIFYEDIYNTHENTLGSIISDLPLIQYYDRDNNGNIVLIGGDN